MSDIADDTGQAQDEAQRHRDGDGAAQLAEALIRQLERIGDARDNNQTVLAPLQLRLVTHYSALTNMLANFGRHGPSRVGILSPPPELNFTKTQLTFPGLRDTAQRLGKTATGYATYDASGALLHRGALVSQTELVATVEDGDLIRTVEIEDVDNIPFLLAFVINTPVG